MTDENMVGNSQSKNQTARKNPTYENQTQSKLQYEKL